MRLDKYLADMGCGTRSELKAAVRKGRVSVDGAVIRDPGYAVTENACVDYDGRRVAYQAFVYVMLNKPAGVITATEDPRTQTVLDLLTGDDGQGTMRRDLAPVGRLDKDTEGLLLITNDGALAHRLLSPKHHVDKVYYARLDGPVGNREAELFAEGLPITDDEPFTAQPADLVILRESNDAPGVFAGPGLPGSEVLVTVREGKYHQIKRMFAQVGRQVTYLKRLKMGPLALDETLKTGEWRYLTDDEIMALQRGAGNSEDQSRR